MKIWVDAQLSPAIAAWIKNTYQVNTYAVSSLGLRDAADRVIFFAAKSENAVVLTKDIDFVRLQLEFSSPPKIIWLTCGNTSNAKLKQILSKFLMQALFLLEMGETVVEIGAELTAIN